MPRFKNLGFTAGEGYGYNPGFFGANPAVLYTNTGNYIQTDDRVSPSTLIKNFERAQVPLAIYDAIYSEIDINDFVFMGESDAVNEALKSLLFDSVDLQDIIDKWVASFWGTGGDFILCKKDSEFLPFSFFEEGNDRVGYRTSKSGDKIIEYVAYKRNSTTDIQDKFPAKNVRHLKYANPHNSLLGRTPAMILHPLWNLKDMILKSQETPYSKGMQASKLLSIQPQAMEGSTPEIVNTYVEKLNILKEELSNTTGLINRNSSVLTSIPGLKVDDLQLNNAEMKSMEIIQRIDELTYITYSQDPGMYDSRLNKYSDSEILRDTKRKAIESKINRMLSLLQTFVMPAIYPEYNGKDYPIKYLKTVTKEELEIKDRKNDETKIFFDFLGQAKSSGLSVSITDEKKEELARFGIVIDETQNTPETVETQEKDEEEELQGEITEEEVEAQRAVDQDELDEVFTKYNETVNMGASELERWADNPCSKEASLDRSPIQRNLRLLRKKKSEWTQSDITAANRTISFVSRMKGNAKGEPIKLDGRTCPSKRDISLKNWAFDPNKGVTRQSLDNARATLTRAVQKQIQDMYYV